ncbi:hypothetical protein [uncultured Tateyamaria sp.]|uniref:hypothetical protein n=1 Tax=uncultured Tateyamaria sp. TaxID=455651 RepID=UPI002629C624|nr:hypothetical protein [uncultured Tateyamaria sp.]
MIDLGTCDVVFLSFDEPNAEDHFERIQKVVPRTRRVAGIKGFDAAHRRAGEVCVSPHVITIDADNVLLDPEFLSARFDIAPRDRARVFSFSARNGVNGLCYGNGGVKIWPRSTLRTLQTHENAAGPRGAVDFCWTVPYYQVNRLLSEVIVTGSDYQAFRAGFREGVKLNLADGQIAYDAYPDLPRAEALATHIGPRNLDRLKVWCSVGADVERGDWAIFGARLGCVMAALDGFDIAKVADYGWMDYFWSERIAPHYTDGQARAARTEALGVQLNAALDLGLDALDAVASRYFKSTFPGHRAYGAMRVV